MIDLRSDTVTRPSAAMRRAMAEAEVGDDVFGEDPTVRCLEEETAALLGREAALFVPSGSMGNAIGVYVSTRSGGEVWAHEHSHVLTHEQGGMAVLARAFPRPFTGADAYPDRAVLKSRIQGADDVHRAEPQLICVENTFMGRVATVERQRAVAEFAREHGMALHLDGARLWNAAAALGIEPAEAAVGADTASVCFSKGLGAPVGSALAASADTVARARRARKLLGGGMRQVGVIAAGALHALRHHRERLIEDHERAARLAQGAAEIPGLAPEARTNMVLVRTSGRSASRWVQALAGHGVACVAMGEDLLRFVVHRDITDEDLDRALARVRAASREDPSQARRPRP